MSLYKILIKTNIKRHKKSIIVFFLFTLVAAMLLYISFQMTTGLKNLYVEKIVETNSPDCSYVLPKNFVDAHGDEIYDLLNKHSEQVNSQDAIMLKDLRIEGANFQPINGAFLVEKTMDGPAGMCIPYVCKSFFGMTKGDSVSFVTDDIQTSYLINGYKEDVLWGSRGNIAFSLGSEEFDTLYKSAGAAAEAIKIDAYGVDDLGAVNDELTNYIGNYSSELDYFNSSDLNFAYNVRSDNTSIYSALLLIGGLFCTVIACVLIVFNIKNTLDEDKKNLGVLIALGCTSRRLVKVYLWQFIIVGAVGIIIGTAVGYAFVPVVMNAIVTDLGFIWHNSLLIGSVLAILLAYVGVVAIVTYLSSMQLNKLRPVEAFTDGGIISSKCKTKLSIEKMPVSISLGIVFKKIIYEKTKSILSCIALAVIVFIAGLSVVIYSRIVAENDGIISITGAEVYDIEMLFKDGADYKNIQKSLEDDPDVEKTSLAIEPGSITLLCDEAVNAKVTIYDDYNNLDYPSLYEGRYPIHENEIAISGNVSEQLNKKIGQQVTITNVFDKENKEETYLIVGYTQGTYTGGLDIYFTYEGLNQVCESSWESIHVYLKDTNILDAKVDEYRELYKDQVTYVGDFRKTFDSQLSSIKESVKIVTYLVVVVAMVLIIFMGYLISNSLISARKREFGIMKAIGYDNRYLTMIITNTFIGFILMAGIMASIALGVGSNKVIGSLFHSMGIHKVEFLFPFQQIIVLITITICVGVLVSIAFSYRIKKIRPCALIK